MLNRYANLNSIEEYTLNELIKLRNLYYKSLVQDEEDKEFYIDPVHPTLRLKVRQ